MYVYTMTITYVVPFKATRLSLKILDKSTKDDYNI